MVIRFLFNMCSDAVDLGIKVVQVIEYSRLHCHGELGRAKLVLAVMGKEHMLKQHCEFPGEIGQFRNLFPHHFYADGYMSQQFPFVSIIKGTT